MRAAPLLKGEVGSCWCVHKPHPNIGAGLQAPRRVWKNNIPAPLLIYSPIFTAALQTLAANVFQLAKADTRMCRANARRFCPTFHSRIFKHRVCTHLLRLSTFLCVGEVFLPLPSQKPGVPTAALVVQEGSRLVAGPGAGARPPDCDALIARQRFSTSSSPSWRTTSRSAG